MDFYVDVIISLIELLISTGVFVVLCYAAKFLVDRREYLSNLKSISFLNINHYFPDEQITELHQLFYLIMILLFVFNIFYLLFNWAGDPFIFKISDVVISLYLALTFKPVSRMDKLLLFLVVPFNSLTMLIFGNYAFIPLDFINTLPYFYFIKIYFDKFMKYTETNSLGITIMLLFAIVFISFIFTIFVEGVSPINSLVMVSNAFTSNGYTILGKSDIGKVDEIILVWAGFILSGVLVANLTVTIVMRHVDESFDRLEEMVKKNRKD